MVSSSSVKLINVFMYSNNGLLFIGAISLCLMRSYNGSLRWLELS